MSVSGTASYRWIRTPDPSVVSEMRHQVAGMILTRQVTWKTACPNQQQCHVRNILPPEVAIKFWAYVFLEPVHHFTCHPCPKTEPPVHRQTSITTVFPGSLVCRIVNRCFTPRPPSTLSETGSIREP